MLSSFTYEQTKAKTQTDILLDLWFGIQLARKSLFKGLTTSVKNQALLSAHALKMKWKLPIFTRHSLSSCTKSFSHLISLYSLSPFNVAIPGSDPDSPKSLNQIQKAAGLNRESSVPGAQTEHTQSWGLEIQPLLPEAVGLAVNFFCLWPGCLCLAFDILVTGSLFQPEIYSLAPDLYSHQRA